MSLNNPSQKYPKKLPAFTILELLVGMTLTSILVTASLYAFQLIQNQYALQTNTQDQIDNLTEFKTRIQLDLQEAQAIKRNQQSLLLRSEKKIIQYLFEPDYLLRQNSQSTMPSDTFWLIAKIENTQFKNEAVLEGWIDNCELNLDYFGETEKYQFHKDYTAAEQYSMTLTY